MLVVDAGDRTVAILYHRSLRLNGPCATSQDGGLSSSCTRIYKHGDETFLAGLNLTENVRLLLKIVFNSIMTCFSICLGFRNQWNFTRRKYALDFMPTH